MVRRRLLWLTCFVGSVVFYWAYREWLSWLIVMVVVFLPAVSLLLSLPAMLTCRMQVRCAQAVSVGEAAPVACIGDSTLPLGEIRGRIRVENTLTGGKWKLANGRQLPTQHCGMLWVSPDRMWVCDYLGLLRLPLGKKQPMKVLVRPVSVEVENPPDMSRYLASAWKPKPGGGFSENHELRLYRPGDSLRQVHWKLSAKTGKLIYREPMEALRGKAALTLTLSGNPEQLDDKLGRLLYMSRHLCQQGIPHEIRCLTGIGMEVFLIKSDDDSDRAVDALLGATTVQEACDPDFGAASWRYHIGGGGGEN